MGILDSLFGKGKSNKKKQLSAVEFGGVSSVPSLEYGGVPFPSQSQTGASTQYPGNYTQPFDEMHWINYVFSLFSQGYGEEEVRNALISQGLTPLDADRILTRVLKQGVMDSSGGISPPTTESNFSSYELSGENNVFDLTPIGSSAQSDSADDPESDYYDNTEWVEEIYNMVENVVNEKLDAFNEKIETLISRIDSLEMTLNALNNRFEETKKSFEEVHEKLDTEIKNLKESISKLDPRVKSLEDAFKDIVPNLVDSVRESKEMVVELKRRLEEKERAMKRK